MDAFKAVVDADAELKAQLDTICLAHQMEGGEQAPITQWLIAKIET